LMQSKAPDQEPVLLAKKGRNALGLFGQKAETGRGLTVAASHVTGTVIKLNAGLAANLNDGCELRRSEQGKPEIEIRISRINGLSSSDAVIVRKASEEATVRPGDLFELVKWVAPDRELMRVYIPGPAPERELRRLTEVAGQLRQLASVAFVSDPTAEAPTHILSWSESQWTLRENRPDAQPSRIRLLSPDAVVRLLPKRPSPRLFVQFPPDVATAGALKFENGAVAHVNSPDLADYVLLGRLEPDSDRIGYAWALANFTQSDLSGGKLPLRPLRTNWLSSRDPLLKDTALGLAKVTGWLNLASPNGDGTGPYQLVLKNADTGQMVSSGKVRDGEKYKLMLRVRGEVRESQRVYVFVVDSFGEAQLLFGNNLDNEFPRPGQTTLADIIQLTPEDAPFTIGTPYGVDNYFLLTSETPIDNPETIFNFDGVRTRGSELAVRNPLTRLLENTALGRRGSVAGVPLDWSIEHLTMVSVESGSK
jgi:hypothetical protein